MPISSSPPRLEARRLVSGRGTYAGDVILPRMAHVAFLRSPHAHARIVAINTARAKAFPGVLLVATAADLAPVCKPMHTVMENAPDHISPPQTPLASDFARWQGEPVVAVVAETRSMAEDAIAEVDVTWEPLPAIVDAVAALEQGAPVVHPILGHNCAIERKIGAKDVREQLEVGDVNVECRFAFNRHTGAPVENRVVVVDYDPVDGRLLVYQSTQVPHQTKDVCARLLGIPEHRIRVICRDVGGGFGTKLHVYPDELATAAIAKLLGRPVRFEACRSESFISDAHSREFLVTAQLSAKADGSIGAIDADMLCAAGAYSIYPRGSIGDVMVASIALGAPYRVGATRTRGRVAYLNKVPTGSYRGVGHPIACAVTEVLVDEAAYALGMDPVEFRRRSYHRKEALPVTTAGGITIDAPAVATCLEMIVERMDYAGLRGEQRRRGPSDSLLGIGVASFVEMTAPGSGSYGPAGVHVSSQDTAILRLDPSGFAHCAVGCTDQGQGTLTGVGQIVAKTLGVPLDHVVVEAGDTNGPHGGGAWASRGLSISGEAAYRVAVALKSRVLEIAGALLQTPAVSLGICDAVIVNTKDGTARMKLAELSEIAHYRQYLLPGGNGPALVVAENYVPSARYHLSSGVQACLLEIDRETGAITLLKHWVVDDCGHIVNPALVEGQLQGGIAQGLGAAFLEHCIYDKNGQLQAGSLLDYALPRSTNIPNIDVEHVSFPQQGTAMGIKGVGEAGTIGAPAAMWCAVNDALRPLGARVEQMPFTAETVFAALRGRR